MLIISVINFLLAGFLGYVLGRFGDYYINFWINDPYWTPHHWIYGLMVATAGSFFLQSSLWLWLLIFGLGLFVSDFKDFTELKVIGKDNKTKSQRRFWNID